MKRNVNQTVLTLDPGKTTGWCFWDGSRYTYGEVSKEELWGFLNLSFDNAPENFLFVVEDFDLREGVGKSALEGPKAIGVIEECARQRKVQVIFVQPAMKDFFTMARLKKKGLWNWRYLHAMDAVKHCMAFRRDYVI